MLEAVPSGKRLAGATIQVRGDRLQINLPRSINPEGKQQRIMSGLANTPEGMARCEEIVAQMNLDIMQGVFDYELVRYGLPKIANKENHLRLLQSRGGSKPKDDLSLKELWQRYFEYRRGTLAETTYINTWQNQYNRLIQNLPNDCKEPLDVRNYFVNSLTPIYQKRILRMLAKCYEWGMRHNLVSDNPYIGMGDDIKARRIKKPLPKSVEMLGIEASTGDYIAFSAEEMNVIISAFENGSHRKHWASFVKFLFWTGCRPGEALALRWKHISSDFRVINFEENLGMTTNTPSKYILKSTKTNENRKFRVYPEGKLHQMLISLKPEGANPDDIVFQSPKGGVAKWRQFCRIWRGSHDPRSDASQRNWGVIPLLAKEGKISQYLKPYATRHTFISLQLQAGANIADLAKQVGNSPDVIMKHYASAVRDLILPEI